jgi:hypothetical protein
MSWHRTISNNKLAGGVLLCAVASGLAAFNIGGTGNAVVAEGVLNNATQVGGNANAASAGAAPA